MESKPDKISREESAALALMKAKVETAKAKAERADMELQLQEMNFNYSVILLYRKYGLSDHDRIADSGAIEYRDPPSEPPGEE